MASNSRTSLQIKKKKKKKKKKPLTKTSKLKPYSTNSRSDSAAMTKPT
jgi:hypothetical protein